MRVQHVGVAAVGVLVLARCAGQRSAQEINRLKSDISLLDQRVGQLERSGMRDTASGEWPAESASAASTPVTGVPTPTAAINAKPAKKEIQLALKNAGFYKGTVDGRLGPRTREAVRSFQQANGLKVDGVVGRQTWEKLFPFLSLASSQPTGEIETAK